MANHPCTDKGFKFWANGLEDAKINPDWDAYDTHIQRLVSRYNDYLLGKGGYVPIDWRLIKAMIWTETGVRYEHGKPWKKVPMQIGVRSDPGMHDLLTNPNRKLVVLPDLWLDLTPSKITSNPYINIEAGTSLLFLRMAHFGLVNVPDKLKTDKQSLADTTHSHKTHHRAHPRPKKIMAITAWRPFTSQMIYMRYNYPGDACYAHKLDYSLQLIDSIEKTGRDAQ
jgi:hypothetical protein